MITNDLKQIILLNPVKTNYSLAKHKREDMIQSHFNAAGLNNGSVQSPVSGDFFPAKQNFWDGVPFAVRREFRSPFWRTVIDLYIKFRLLFTKPKKDSVEFFMEVKNNFHELKNTDIDDEKIKLMIQNLEKTRQNYAISTIMTEKNLKILENRLVENGFTQYQTEESLIDFVKQCKKGLCLQEVEYFTRVIPDDVMEKFDKAEEMKVFDNYYILFNDPSGANNIFYTEKPKPKDPIMFGVIKGSNKLYFIADWIDEFCNLTYKDILKNSEDYKLKKQNEE